jgi:hypothetical protein
MISLLFLGKPHVILLRTTKLLTHLVAYHSAKTIFCHFFFDPSILRGRYFDFAFEMKHVTFRGGGGYGFPGLIWLSTGDMAFQMGFAFPRGYGFQTKT